MEDALFKIGGVIQEFVHWAIVVGVLGTISLRLKENLRTLGVDTSSELTQISALLGTERILRKVLER